MGGRTLAAAFDPRHNSLNALRLVLASLVIVSHAWPVGGFGLDPSIGDMALGEWAVAGFFAISGFLIARSRLRTSLGSFLWRRMLRIFPGLWLCLLVTVLVFAPVAAAVEAGRDGVDVRSLVSYVLDNGTLQRDHLAIAGTLDAQPFPGTWNGSLWTLFYEFGCYVILGLALSISALRRPSALLAMFAGTAAVHVADVVAGIPMPATIGVGAGLATYFFGGAALFAYSDRIRVSAVLAGGCAAVLALAALAEHARPVSALPLAYLMLWLGIVLPFARVGRRNDVSYGVYIYAFPVQQLLVLAGTHKLGVAPYIALAFVCTAPLAVASWFLVEKPAMELKRVSPAGLLPRRRAVAEPVEVGAETSAAR